MRTTFCGWKVLSRGHAVHFRCRAPEPALISFWLRELRTPELLHDVALQYPDIARAVA